MSRCLSRSMTSSLLTEISRYCAWLCESNHCSFTVMSGLASQRHCTACWTILSLVIGIYITCLYSLHASTHTHRPCLVLHCHVCLVYMKWSDLSYLVNFVWLCCSISEYSLLVTMSPSRAKVETPLKGAQMLNRLMYDGQNNYQQDDAGWMTYALGLVWKGALKLLAGKNQSCSHPT